MTDKTDALVALADKWINQDWYAYNGQEAADYCAKQLREALAAPAEGGQGDNVIGCGDHDHDRFIPGCAKCAATLPEKHTPPAASVELVEAVRELRRCQRDYLSQPKGERIEAKGRLVGLAADRVDAALALIDSAGGAKGEECTHKWNTPNPCDACSAIIRAQAERLPDTPPPAEGDGAVAKHWTESVDRALDARDKAKGIFNGPHAPRPAATAVVPRPSDDELWDQTLRERDDAEKALGDMFQVVTGRSAEWSSAWHYKDAIEEVEDHMAMLAVVDRLTAAKDGVVVTAAMAHKVCRDYTLAVEGCVDFTPNDRAIAAMYGALKAALNPEPQS